MKQPKWLLQDFVIAAHNMVLSEHGGPAGIRDLKMLESALARPQNKNAYEPKSTAYDLAAAYSYGIAMDHPFVDGNKRIAATFLYATRAHMGVTLNQSMCAALLVGGSVSEDRDCVIGFIEGVI